jgi:predicted dehydrogenase
LLGLRKIPEFKLTGARCFQIFRETSRTRALSASTKTKLRIGVIGAGQWGPNLIRNFSVNPETEVVWVSDLDEERLHALGKNYQGIQITRNWSEVIDDPSVEAVVVCTPTASHFPIAMKALEAGKHLFVEKPLTTSYTESMVLVELAERKSLKLMVGHVFLFNPAIRHLKLMMEKKELGEILYLYSTRTNLGPIRADVNALWDLGSHDISLFLYLLEALPVGVRCTGSAFINRPIEDVVFGTLHFSNGTLANLHASWLDPRKVRELVVVGTEKMVVFDDMSPEENLKIYERTVGDILSKNTINDTIHHFRKSIIEGRVTIPALPAAEPLKIECQAFIDWILRDTPQPSHGAFAADVVYILERMAWSLSQKDGARLETDGRKLSIPAPGTEKEKCIEV